jgi:hypothetical protein
VGVVLDTCRPNPIASAKSTRVRFSAHHPFCRLTPYAPAKIRLALSGADPPVHWPVRLVVRGGGRRSPANPVTRNFVPLRWHIAPATPVSSGKIHPALASLPA